MGRIKQTTDSVNQKGRKLLIPYLVAGDPNKETTIELMHALVSNGADILNWVYPSVIRLQMVKSFKAA